MKFDSIAVIGAGQMGSGIAEVVAAQGISARLCDVSIARATEAKARIEKGLARLVDKGKVTSDARARILENIRPESLDDALRGAELVVEAASEDLALKRELFRKADALAAPDVILASNTSSISITLLAAETKRPERVIGMHFMNPVPIMRLVEVVRGLQTSEETLERVRALAERLGKTVILSADSPGFLVNRVLYPLLNEACFTIQEHLGSVEDVDAGARLGLNHPMGPLELADLIGLDTLLALGEVMHRGFGDGKYRPATLLRNLVAAGWLGRKTGKGFYEYDSAGKKLGPSKLGGLS